MRLTEPQLRHLTAGLATVEIWLDKAETIASAPYHGTLVGIEPGLTEGQRRAFLQRAASLRTEMARVVTYFDLPRADRSAAQEISALLGVMWQTLEETRPVHFAGYGTLEPEVSRALGTFVDTLLDQVEALRGVLDSDRLGHQ